MTKWVYTFGDGRAEGEAGMKNLLGGKGANLAEMSNLGLPVPPGFTITTEVCTYFYAHKKTYPKELQSQMEAGVANMEKIMGTKFGATIGTPLLVAVRSGARDSMPGMMDTILNLGLNDQTVLALVKATGNERFAWDCYRRFIQMYGDVVLGVQKREGEDHEPFETVIHALKADRAGNVLLEMGRVDEAAQAYEEAARRAPDRPDIQNNLGALRRHQQRPVEAEAAYRRAIELDPKYADAYTNLGSLLEALTARGFRVVGPAVRDGAIVYEDLESAADLPIGWTDTQDAGRYRLTLLRNSRTYGHYEFEARDAALSFATQLRATFAGNGWQNA